MLIFFKKKIEPYQEYVLDHLKEMQDRIYHASVGIYKTYWNLAKNYSSFSRQK